MQQRNPDFLPAADQSALSDKLECLYNLVYLMDHMVPAAGRGAEDSSFQQHLHSIRTHLDAMRSILGNRRPAGSERSRAADAA